MLKIELRPFFEGDGESLNIDCEFRPLDNLFSSAVKVTGEIKSAAGLVSIDALAKTSITKPCDRCASVTTKELSVPVKHFLVERLNDEDCDEYILVPDLTLNVPDLVLEDIYLSLPSRFLCKDDCKGLCPLCGKNLNEGGCTCKRPVDPRLSVLSELDVS